jgi:YD repeat-containing protein
VTQSTDARGGSTLYGYDSYNLFVASTTDPAGLNTQYLYNYAIGKPKQTTDPNGLVFQTVYDGLGRPTQELQPDLTNPSTLVTKTTYAYVDTPLNVSVHTTQNLDGSLTHDLYEYFDGLGRSIQTREQSETANTYIAKDKVYDVRGNVWKESLPYFSSGTSRTSATTSASLYTTYAYDALNRITQASNAVGTTTNAYAPWHVTTTDPNGKPKDFFKDAYGQLVNVVEHNSGSNATTTYAWDAVGNLTKITDALSNVRNFVYDGLGRRLTAEDLHASGDGTFGTWTYAYDDAGNTTQTVDPKSQTVNYTFDGDNRPLTEDFASSTGTEITYSYDSCTNGKTRLCVASSTASRILYTYNPLGMKASEAETINGTSTILTTQYG